MLLRLGDRCRDSPEAGISCLLKPIFITLAQWTTSQGVPCHTATPAGIWSLFFKPESFFFPFASLLSSSGSRWPRSAFCHYRLDFTFLEFCLQTAAVLWCFDLRFFNFMMVQKQYTYSRDCALNFEFCSTPRRAMMPYDPLLRPWAEQNILAFYKMKTHCLYKTNREGRRSGSHLESQQCGKQKDHNFKPSLGHLARSCFRIICKKKTWVCSSLCKSTIHIYVL